MKVSTATGLGMLVLIVIMVGFWGTFAYSVVVRDMALVEQLVRVLTAAASVTALVAVIQAIWRTLSRS